MINLVKSDGKILPDSSRVIVKPNISGSAIQIKRIINRVLNLSEEQVNLVLSKVLTKYADRHKNIFRYFEENFNHIKRFLPPDCLLSNNQKALLGAYFSCEYSIQSAACFNPSIVTHPNQNGVNEGCMRFILSLRSVGEGHISSVEFRSGIIDNDCNMVFDKISPYTQPGEVTHFSHSDYVIRFSEEDELSERILFPSSGNDINGIEDARFVRFVDEDFSVTYYATYTAYDGRKILPQMIETRDFLTFNVFPLNGDFAIDKGMALFPKKINGKYAMISRVDGENLYLMYSDDIKNWQRGELIKEPENYWEFGKIGNCGSPVETDRGWILLTHGVGPMREYSIGLVLLDLENPAKIVGNMSEPMLVCSPEEREGYVPNVVYSCGSIIHNGKLVVPYAMSDTCCGIVKMSLADIFNNVQSKEISEVYANSS